MMLGNGCPPWAFALPLNSPDFGTSRWQLRMEPYTNLCATEQAHYARLWPTSTDLCDAQSRQLSGGTADAPVERPALPPLTQGGTAIVP